METPASAWETPPGTLILTRQQVRQLLGMPECIAAVEEAFRHHALGQAIPPAVLGVHVEGGGFHIKTAGMQRGTGPAVFVAKINANFPRNPAEHGLPTIQGVLALFDATDGRVLALLDSIELTSVRTAAATAVAARYLARADAATVNLCGCGEQGRYQLRALASVRPIRRVTALDLDPERARRFAAEVAEEFGLEVRVVRELAAAPAADIWVTCTPASRWFLGRGHVAPGTFVAAVGADNHLKQEIEPDLLATSAVVTDITDQCVAIGDLHHAIAAGVMDRDEVRAELGEVVSGQKPGRLYPEEIIVFDSTGTALQDVAAAELVYRRALAAGIGVTLDLGATHASEPAR